MDNDTQYLRLLSIFHYVLGGMAALIGCIPIIHLVVGVAMVTGQFDAEGKNPPPPFLGWFFITFASAFIVTIWVFAATLVVAGLNLARRRRYWFCFVIACLACCFQPFGTVLGVFTIIVLLRPSVKALFGVESGAGSSPS